MSTSDTEGRATRKTAAPARNRTRRTLAAFAGISLAAFLFDKVYTLFAHGVSSPHMTWLFLYPLLGGLVFYGLIALLFPGAAAHRGWRAGCNFYNAGLATVAAGSLLTGIFRIAGTASPYTVFFWAFGAVMALAGLIAMLIPISNSSAL